MSNLNISPINQTWVCVLQTPGGWLQVILSGHPRHLDPSAGKLLMARCFADDLEAMGYRLLLQRMCIDTLWNLIHRENPKEKNRMDKYINDETD